MRIYGITGWKNSGKTGLMERLIEEYCCRGLTVSTIKHAHHSFDLDQPGRDSYRHRTAGAQQVLLTSRNRYVLMHELHGSDEPSLDELLSKLAPVDLVLIEGFKSAVHPKIEAVRAVINQPLMAPQNPTIKALASDTPLSVQQPVFDLNDTAGIADFIMAEVGL